MGIAVGVAHQAGRHAVAVAFTPGFAGVLWL